MLSIWYDDPDAGPVDITGSVKYGIGEIKLQTKAEQGAVATSSIVVQDPDGIYDFRGLRRVWVEESDADFARIYTGWVWGKSYTRGDYYRTGAARQVTLELQDLNHLLWQKIMAGSDTTRPSESDVTRMQWLLATGEAAAVIDDTTTYVFTGSPVTMDANPNPGYNGQTFQNVVDDAAQDSGKNYYVLDVFDGYDYVAGIWYGADGLDEFVSDATISNIEYEVDNVTIFWADIAATLDVDPSRVFSGIFGNFDGGWTYQTNATTLDEFANRDTTSSWPNVKTQAKAAARAQRQLLQINTEEEAVTVTIYSMLPSQVNIFRAGMRVNGVKFTHFPGWENGRDCRIVTKTIADQAEGLYSVELELLPIGPPVTCSTAITAATVTQSDSGIIPTDYPGGGSSIMPYTFNPDDPSDTRVMIAAYWDRNSFDAEGVGPTGSVAGDYTMIGCTRTTWTGAFSSLGICGYYATSGPGGDFTIDYNDNWFEEARAISIAIGSSSTSPVHSGSQIGTGGTVTLDGTPTPGNILIFVMFAEGVAGGIPPGLEDTCTLLAAETIKTSTIHVMSCSIYARCVVEGDTDEIFSGDYSFSHWCYVTEWAP